MRAAASICGRGFSPDALRTSAKRVGTGAPPTSHRRLAIGWASPAYSPAMTEPSQPTLRHRVRRRARRLLGWTVLFVVVLVASGVILADYLRPRGTGAPSEALAVQPAQTELDRELAPLLAQHPGQTGVLMVSNGLDAFAMRAIAARKAGRSLDLMYYMWHDDLTGRLLAREVVAAADRGVRVRLLLDDINAEGLDAQMLALDAHPNIELRLFNAFRNRAGPARLLETLQRAESI